jgi:hypothetical protein
MTTIPSPADPADSARPRPTHARDYCLTGESARRAILYEADTAQLHHGIMGGQ